jgi:hypothetical protein
MFYLEPENTPDEPRGFGERLVEALAFARALLTLEDDYDVEWDLPVEFERRASAADGRRARGRRAARRASARRPGSVRAAPQVCLSPLPARPAERRHEARGR